MAAMTNNSVLLANVNVDDEPKSQAAFERMLPKYMALPATDQMRINVDLVLMVTKVLGRAPRINALRADMQKQLPELDLSAVDDLEDSALALEYAHNRVVSLSRPSDGLTALNLEQTLTREAFIQDLRNLAASGWIDPSCLRNLKRATGYKLVVEDVGLCISVYRNHWPRILGKTCCTIERLDRAEAVMHRMKRLVGQREAAAAGRNEWLDLRARAYTVLYRNYDEARRAVQYLRWHQGDADKIAPSIFAGRNCSTAHGAGARPKAKAPVQPEGREADAGPNGPFVAAPAAIDANPRLPGMPGGGPFES